MELTILISGIVGAAIALICEALFKPKKTDGQIVVDFDAEAPITMKLNVGVGELMEKKSVTLDVYVNYDSLNTH